MELKPLRIGNIEAKYPIVQGGMGIGIEEKEVNNLWQEVDMNMEQHHEN